MLNKIIHFLIIILFITIPIVNSHLLDFFGLAEIGKKFYVNGNYEFSKILFFNIISGIIILLFSIGTIIGTIPLSKTSFTKEKDIFIPKIIYFIILLLIISNIYSLTFFTSLLGNSEKGHSTMMFLNLSGLLIVFINLFKNSKELKNTILKVIIFSTFIISLLGIKEFLLPHFNYGDLGNRAISTFGHPNYLALYLILIIPIINNFLTNSKGLLKKYIFGIILFFVIICLFLTKSVWAIFIFFNYLIYLKYKDIQKIIHLGISSFNTKGRGLQSLFFWLIYLLIIIISILLILNLYPEKLSSFVSRFYIWETTLSIIFSDITIFIIGNGLGNLDLVFEGFKNKELYIFENYGFVADDSHNIFINIFYNFGIIGLGLFGYLLFNLIKNNSFLNFYSLQEQRNRIYIEIIIIFLLFNLFNFSSIASYLVLIFIVSLIIKKPPNSLIRWNSSIFISIFFIFTSLFSIYFYSIYFLEEHKFYNNENYKTNNYFLNKIESENIEKNLFNKYYNDYEKLCKKLIQNSTSAENYFYCGDLLYLQNKKLAINYYNLGLKKLPDLWNNDSKYYDNIFINKNNLKHRFFSEKYGDINIILERALINQ